ncbi:hypothetical protein [Flavobacterium sp. XGLA_31]|uniref:hypothetical protein n=1 Tax=Flavobacterium sp. XGLA_31 TaxID=3447666 RepID=UPI003F3AB2CA
METEKWIQNILDSTNGMQAVAPSETLFSKIQEKIKQQDTVSPQTVWLVAASILVLIFLNFTLLRTSKSQQNSDTSTAYFETTLNQSNQLYQ